MLKKPNCPACLDVGWMAHQGGIIPCDYCSADKISGVNKWDQRFLSLARYISAWSLDPSTKTAAIITDGKRIVSLGYNGFAQGVRDLPERYADRETKLAAILHCEVNAILFANRPLQGCTLYTWPFSSCSRCAAQVIQSGIKRCVAPPMSEELAARWGKECELARTMFEEAGVRLELMEIKE